MTNHIAHPVAHKLGIQLALQPDSHLVYSSVPGKETQWQYARVRLTPDHALEFSISDNLRSFSASFNSDGKVTSLICSTGIPSGDTEKVIELFFEEARLAIESLELLH